MAGSRASDRAGFRRVRQHKQLIVRGYSAGVERSAPSTPSTAERSALSEEQRAERLRLLAERLRRPGGLDREALERIEQLADDAQ